MWLEDQKLTATDAALNDEFGSSVAISGDTIVLDRRGTSYLKGPRTYVFKREGLQWTQVAKLEATDGANSDEFGISVAVNGDTIVVGSPSDDDPTNSGSAYVFRSRDEGTTWLLVATLTATDAAAFDQFGTSVAISSQGTVVIGSPLDDDDAGPGSGSVYLFQLGDDGETYSQVQKFTATDAAAGDQFATSVAISGDNLLVGSPEDDDPTGSGSASVFSL